MDKGIFFDKMYLTRVTTSSEVRIIHVLTKTKNGK